MPRRRKWLRPIKSEERVLNDVAIVQDGKEEIERQRVKALLDAWGWPKEAQPVKLGDPAKYDFDCRNPVTGEAVAIEIKEAYWSKHFLTKAQFEEEVVEPLRHLYVEVLRHMKKANDQLATALAGLKCVLFVWQYEPEDEHSWQLLRGALGRIRIDCYRNVDGVWVTSLHLRRFFRVEWEQRCRASPASCVPPNSHGAADDD